MPLIKIKIPCSVATQKRIRYDYGQSDMIPLKRHSTLYALIAPVVDVTGETPIESGIVFQLHCPCKGVVSKQQVGATLDRHYNQLRNELLGMRIRQWDNMTIIANALMQYNEDYGIETDVDITLEAMQKSWTRWCQAEKEKKIAISSFCSDNAVHPPKEDMAISESNIHLCIQLFMSQHRRKFIRKQPSKGISERRVFELCCYVYRKAGFDQSDMALIFNCDASGCRKAAERFKYRLIEWRKQGIEPPQLN
jgi:hypothetical protein